MNTLLDSTNAFFFCLLRLSSEAAALIVLVLLAQRLFRKQLPPKWRHTLWLLVVLRLALPWSLPGPNRCLEFIPAPSARFFQRFTKPGDGHARASRFVETFRPTGQRRRPRFIGGSDHCDRIFLARILAELAGRGLAGRRRGAAGWAFDNGLPEAMENSAQTSSDGCGSAGFA
jgi:hypothetical protein